MDDSSQDPVFSEEISGVDFERQCSVNSNFSVNDKIVRAKIPEVKSAPTVALETLSIEDVCFLLDHSQLSAIASTARENQFSGMSYVNATYFNCKTIKKINIEA